MCRECITDSKKAKFVKKLIKENAEQYAAMSMILHNPYDKMMLFLLGLGLNRSFVDSIDYKTLYSLGCYYPH